MEEMEPLILEIHGRTAHIVLDRPPDNRMNRKFFSSLSRIVEEIRECKGIGAVLVYSSGRHFSAGADVEDVKKSALQPYLKGEDAQETVCENARVLRQLETLDVPVISAISGVCTGSGLELALACNIRICSTDALLGCPELSWGIITGLSGSIRLEKTVGRSRAKEIILRGDMINGKEAYDIGLVDILTKRSQLLPTALKLAGLYSEQARSIGNTHIKKCIMNV